MKPLHPSHPSLASWRLWWLGVDFHFPKQHLLLTTRTLTITSFIISTNLIGAYMVQNNCRKWVAVIVITQSYPTFYFLFPSIPYLIGHCIPYVAWKSLYRFISYQPLKSQQQLPSSKRKPSLLFNSPFQVLSSIP